MTNGPHYARLREDRLQEVIRKVGAEWCVFSEAGERLGCHPTEEAAKRQLAAVEIRKVSEASQLRLSDEQSEKLVDMILQKSETTGQPIADVVKQEVHKNANTDEQDGGPTTTPDERDGHTHEILQIDDEGNGRTSVESGEQSEPHSHTIRDFMIVPHTAEDGSYQSVHPGRIEVEAETPEPTAPPADQGGNGGMDEGRELGAAISRLIDQQVNEEAGETRADVIARVAAAAGIETSTLSAIMSGEIDKPPRERLARIAQALGVEVDTLADRVRGERQEVVQESAALPARLRFLREADSGNRPRGTVWDVVLISRGVSANHDKKLNLPRYYGDVLRKPETAAIFEGKPLMVFEADVTELLKIRTHLPDGIPAGMFARQKVGWVENVRYGEFTEADGTKGEGLLARAFIVDSDLREPLVEAWDAGKDDFHDLSINAGGLVRQAHVDGQDVAEVIEIAEAESVDMVSDGARGGRMIRLAAAKSYLTEGKMTRAAMLAMLSKHYSHLLEGKDVTKLTDDEVGVIYGAALREAKSEPGKGKGVEQQKEQASAEAATLTEDQLGELVEKRVQAAMWPNEVAAALSEAKLPDEEVKHLSQLFRERVGDRESLQKEITRTKKLLGQAADAATRAAMAEGEPPPRVSLAEEKVEKIEKGLRASLREADKQFKGDPRVDGIPPFRSLFQAYQEVSGDYRSSRPRMAQKILEGFAFSGHYLGSYMDSGPGGQLEKKRRIGRLREALETADWPQVLGNALEKQRLELADGEDVNKWRELGPDITSSDNLYTKRRIRIGGYGEVPIVTEGQDFPAAASPADQEVQINLDKRGFTEEVTLEMLLRDNINQVMQLPNQMMRAGLLTLQRDIFDLLINNEALTFDDDVTALFTAGHNNLSTTALSRAQVLAAIESMMAQLKFGSTIDFLAEENIPDILLVDFTQWDQAETIVNAPFTFGVANEFQLPSNIKGKVQKVITLSHSTDTNDWFLVNSRGQTIEVVFLNGMERPELFVQDMPNVGATFTADKIVWKLRHWWGKAVQDFRPFFGGIVA